MDRRDALKRLIEKEFNGSQADFARAIDRSPSLVWQCLNGHRPIGEKLARTIEGKLRLKRGSLDSGSVDFNLSDQPYLPGSAVAQSEIDLLIANATPSSRRQLLAIARALAEDRLSDADIQLLGDIAKRMEKGVADHRDDYPNLKPD
tara:strand:- start:13038 stop:13478 length:441 start_codon:yes stop_codon:yes gene_type:complete